MSARRRRRRAATAPRPCAARPNPPREAFEAALEDPDSLAPHVRKDIDGTPMAYVARDAYEKVTGSELPTPTLDLFAEPIGEPVLQSDLSTRFPRVAKALGVE